MKSHLNIKPCSLCTRYTEYYCHSCQGDLCLHCKTVHVIDLETKHPKVTIYREILKKKTFQFGIHVWCITICYTISIVNLVEFLCVILALIIVISQESPRFFLPVSFPEEYCKHPRLGIRAVIKQSDSNTVTKYIIYEVTRSMTKVLSWGEWRPISSLVYKSVRVK